MNNPNNPVIEIATEIRAPQAQEAVALFVSEADTSRCGATGELLSAVENLLAEGDFKAEEESSLFVHTSDSAHGGGHQRRRLLLLGMGRHGGEDDPRAYVRAAGTATRQARAAGVKHLQLLLPACPDRQRIVRALTEGALLGLYDGDFYQNHDEPPPVLERITIVVPEASVEFEAAIERGRVVAEAVNWARYLSDEPGLSLPPREFARRAAAMAAEFGLKVESLDAAEVRRRGMGGLVGVGQGSDEEPALIVVRYEPEGAAAEATDGDGELWAFVGKGITFDTGGISLKKPPHMEEMKSDMAGGAAVLGALRAIAQIKPRRRIVGIIPSAENMPSGRSIKPGDIVRTLAGYTIEVVDTDAEGRLVLVDGIAYARELGATRIVDLATLTGSIIVALGTHRTGLFSNDDDWAARVTAAAERAGEPVWRMPVGDDYKKRIESPIADFKNYGGRPDATAAALLLSKFADTTPWVHLDIAGTAWYEEPLPYAPKGTSGTGVRTLVELACDE